MRKLKLFFACLLMAVLSIGQVWAADVLAYTIEFQPTTSSTSGRTTSNFVTDMVTSGSSYISSCTATANAYPDVNQIKLGSSSKVGNFTLSLSEAGQVKATKVVLSAKYYDSGKTITLTANSTSETFTPTNAFADYEVTLDGESNLTTISVASVTASKGRMYVNAIKVYVADGGGSTPTPSLSVSPSVIDFGTVDQNAVVANKTVAVTFENLTGSVTYDGLSGAFSASGSISATGDEITISANTATVGEYSQTLTVQSAADSKSQDVTVKMNVVEPFDGSVLEIVKGDFTNTSYDDNAGDHEKGGITFTTAKVYQSGGGIQFQKTNGLLYNKTDLGEIAKIEITTVSGKSNNLVVYSGTTENPTSGAVTGSTSGGVTTYTFASGNGYFAIKCNSTGASNVDPIKIYYTSSASSVAKPTISGTDNFLSSTEVTMECSTEGAAIYYTITESAKATPATSGDWAAYSGASKPSFFATTTVWAAAKLGDDWSAVAEQTFTKATILTTAAELVSFATTTDQQVYVNLANWKVTFVSGDYVYLVDASNEGVVLKQASHGYTAGDVLADVAYQVTAKKSSGRVQLSGFTSENISATSGTVEPSDVTDYSTITAANQSALVTLKEATYDATSGTFSDGVNEIYFFDQFSASPTLIDGKNYDVTGIVIYYKTNTAEKVEIAPRTSGDVVPNEVIVIPTAANLAALKAATRGTYILTLENAVVTYVNGKNAFIEEGTTGGLIFFQDHGYNAGDALNGDYQVTTEDYNGKFEITAMTPQAGATTTPGQTIPEALLTIAQLNENFATYESRRVKIKGVTVTNPLIASSNDRQGTISDGAITFALYAGIKNTIDAAQDAYINIVGYPGFNNTDQQLTVWENADIFVYSDPELAWSEDEADAFIGQSNTFPSLTNDHNVAVTYSSTETNYATISNEAGHEGEITLKAVGATVIKATFAGDETYKPAEVSYTLNVYEPITSGTITYEENGGSEVADVETPVENLPDPLPEPTKAGFNFGGWWTTSTFEDGSQAVAGAPMSGDIILYAKWIQIPPYALVYTSNVDFVGAGSYKEDGSKVIISETEYAAQKVGSSSNTGEVVVTVPAKTHTLHFHVFTWKNQSNVTSISGVNNIKVNGVSGTTINVNGDNAGGGSKTYTIESDPVSHYQYITFDAVDVPTDITFAYSSGDKRIIMYGINQEGGVLPVLDHIVITGDATELEYEVGDEFNPAGLGVNAIYTLEEVEQTPVAVDAADIEWSFDPAHIAANTESVTVTATVGGKSANKTVENIVVNIPTPEILVNPASVAFGTVNQDATVDAEVINVTLKTVANATIALTGDVAAFTLDKTALTENGTISVTPVTSVAGTFAATITISDEASAAESKEVALSMTVKAPEIPDVCDGTDDFATIDKTVSPTGYATRTTTDGWVGTNVRFQEIDEKMYWKINGKTTAVGTITSPVLSDGIATLKFRYANTDNESNGVSVKIEIKQSGDVVKEYTLTKANSEVTKDEVYTEIIENINVAGDFQIVFTNLSPSNSTSNKDRVAIGRLCWTGYTAPEPPVVDYTEVRKDLTEGWYYTMCLDKAVTAVKAGSIWKVLSKAANGKDVILEEAELPLVAGRPYIFLAAANTLEVAYTGDAVGAPVNDEDNNGLIGSFTQELITESATNFIIYENALYFVNSEAYVGAHRAYLNMTGVPAYSNEPQQGAPRRRVTMTVYNEQTTTGIDELNASDTPVKMIIDGQLFIIRGEKMFDATGRLVK